MWSEGRNKHAKRENEANMKRRYYHVQKASNINFRNVKMSTQGLPKGAHNGLLTCYNLRSKKDLGVGIAAVCRIPCSCLACIFQLQNPWKSRVTRNEQPRYSSSVGC